jgi:hypothetical protein
MAIPVDRVSRVIINGEWYSVEVGSFRIEELRFVDAEGRPTHGPSGELAYRFTTPNRDEYHGPLRAIDLIKVVGM